MAIRAETTPRDPSREYVGMSRRRRGEEGDELQDLFEELMTGEGEEGLEDFDWDELWDSFMGGEEATGAQGMGDWWGGGESRQPRRVGVRPFGGGGQGPVKWY